MKYYDIIIENTQLNDKDKLLNWTSRVLFDGYDDDSYTIDQLLNLIDSKMNQLAQSL